MTERFLINVEKDPKPLNSKEKELMRLSRISLSVSKALLPVAESIIEAAKAYDANEEIVDDIFDKYMDLCEICHKTIASANFITEFANNELGRIKGGDNDDDK